jgi:hypothetical protein
MSENCVSASASLKTAGVSHYSTTTAIATLNRFAMDKKLAYEHRARPSILAGWTQANGKYIILKKILEVPYSQRAVLGIIHPAVLIRMLKIGFHGHV